MSGGANPFGAQPRPANLREYGQGYSGLSAVVGTQPTQVFNIKLREIVPNGYAGMATVHVWIEDAKESGEEQPPNSMLVAEISWQSGRGGGRQMVDLTRGHKLNVGGTSIINMQAWLVSAIEGVPIEIGLTKKVQATINWFGDAHALAQFSTPTQILAENNLITLDDLPENIVETSLEPSSAPAANPRHAEIVKRLLVDGESTNPGASCGRHAPGVESGVLRRDADDGRDEQVLGNDQIGTCAGGRAWIASGCGGAAIDAVAWGAWRITRDRLTSTTTKRRGKAAHTSYPLSPASR